MKLTKSQIQQIIKEEIEEHFPRDFWTEENIEGSIECVLTEMYKEIKPEGSH